MVEVALSDGSSTGTSPEFLQRPEDYWKNVPSRFRNRERFAVERQIRLGFHRSMTDQTIKVREIGKDTIVWAFESPPAPKPIWEEET